MAEKRADALADKLRILKDGSGLSYETLARKCLMSRSSLHRYCAGTTKPADFGSVERIANACGASRADVNDLYRLWRRAVDADPPPQARATPVPARPAPAVRRALSGTVVLVLAGAAWAAHRAARRPPRRVRPARCDCGHALGGPAGR